jgi:predicted  nucleic acid-binding Zn-ribbon protein
MERVVKQTLENLVELQGIDDALRDLREARTRLTSITKENAESLVVFDKMLSIVGDRIAETQTFCREKEDEIREAESNLSRSRQRMNSIQSQKELTALNKELDAARKASQSRAEELGKLQEQLRGVEVDHARRTEERNKLVGDMRAIEQHLTDEIAKKEASLDELQARRKALIGTLPRDLMSKYERISKGRNGVAVIPISTETCTGCNMAVPPQVFIRLMRTETLEACANCSRLLVYRPGAGGVAAADTGSLSE